MTLLEYIRLDEEQKRGVIDRIGHKIDQYVEKELIISVYRVYNFFVETIIDPLDGRVVDLIPYKGGFGFYLRAHKRVQLLNHYFII